MSPSTAERLAERETAAGIAATLAWTGTGALHWLRKVEAGEADPSNLADYGRRLREIAAQLDTLSRGINA